MRIWAVLPVLAAFSAFAAFYDDFEDNDMSGWQPVWGSATWSESDGCINGSTSNSPCGLAPVGRESSLDCVIQTKVEGVHAFGVIFRRISNNGICAYVSPDADVARISLITGGELGSELASLGASFPSRPTCYRSHAAAHR
jgi:hypothetical protein